MLQEVRGLALYQRREDKQPGYKVFHHIFLQ